MQTTRRRLADARMDPSRLLALVPPSGHIPDFLTPSPTEAAPDLDAELRLVAQTTPADLLRDLGLLTAAGPAWYALQDACDRPQTFVRQIADELRCYWEIALAPSWRRIRSLAESDIAWRSERIVGAGIRDGLSSLHDRIRVDGEHLIVRTTCHAPDPAPIGAGVVLVPCAFAWPEVLLLDTGHQPATLAYTPRGTGMLWAAQTNGLNGIPGLIGRTRTNLLNALDLPATNSELAERLGLTPPTTSQHLQILLQAGAVSRRRTGRLVYYARSPLGEALVTEHSMRDGDLPFSTG
ncbi:winged helix-turn-helix domain-containing protein [Kribbella sancticallisti]|uniref:winged helix-turn-helix domain-containing protein n=1 Tax=Kribbella sancticallisti TaxID=460087 RepID=UPI0031D08440